MLILTANAATASSNYQELEQAGTLSYGRMVPDGPHARQFQNCATGKYIVVDRSHKVTNVNATKCPGVPPLVAFNGATKFAPVAGCGLGSPHRKWFERVRQLRRRFWHP